MDIRRLLQAARYQQPDSSAGIAAAHRAAEGVRIGAEQQVNEPSAIMDAPMRAAQEFLRFAAVNRAPSLWGQIPAGTVTLRGRAQGEAERAHLAAEGHQKDVLAETARDNEAARAHQRAVLAETARANRAAEAINRESMRATQTHRAAAAATPTAALPTTAAERTALAEAAATHYMRLLYSGIHQEKIEQHTGDGRFPWRTEDLASATIQRFVRDPGAMQDIQMHGVDMFNVLNNFSLTTLGLPLDAFMKTLNEQDPVRGMIQGVAPDTQFVR